MSDDKRDHERVEILGELPGAATVVQPIAVKQLSLGGAQVESAFPLQIESLHEFRLELAGRPVVVKGRVAHCRISHVDQETVTYLSGIQFVDPPEWVTDAIASFIEGLKSGRRPA